MAAPGHAGSEGPGSELPGLQPDDGVRQATGRTNSRQRDRAGSIRCEHCPDGNSHGAWRDQPPGEQPTPATAARNLWKRCPALLLRGDHCIAAGIRHGPAVHLPNIHCSGGLAVAGGTAAPSHWLGRAAGLDRCGVCDPTGMAWCRPKRAGVTPSAGSTGWRFIYSSGLCVRSTLIGQGTPLGDHSLLPAGLDSPHVADGSAKRGLAFRGGLDLVARRRCADPTRPDLGDQRAELSASGEGDIAELCPGVVCCKLGVDLVQRIDYGIHLCWCSAGAGCILYQPLQPSALIRSARGQAKGIKQPTLGFATTVYCRLGKTPPFSVRPALEVEIKGTVHTNAVQR